MLKTLVLESLGWGGHILVTDTIENHPGFSENIKGPELSQLMCEQAQKYGAEIRNEEVTCPGSYRFSAASTKSRSLT